MRLAKFIFIILILSGCSESTKNLDPSDHVLRFIESPDYELLSKADRSVWPRDEWNEQIDSWRAPRPTLSPTNKYFKLEQNLYQLASYQIKGVTHNQDGSYTITVIFKFPTVLEEVHFFDDIMTKYVGDELENLMIAYESDQLTPDTINYSEIESTYTVVSDGIFVNAEEVQKHQEENEKIDQLFGQLSHIDDYDLDFIFYSPNTSKLIKQIKELRAIGIEQINLDILSLESAIIQTNELQSERSNYSSLQKLGNLHQAKVLLESDSIFSESLNFNKIIVGKAQGSDNIGLFFDWSITSDSLPYEAVSAGFQAKYFDDGLNQIGSENFLISSVSTKNGDRGGSVGLIIDNQGVARRTSNAEVSYLVPSIAPIFNCKFEETIKCEPL